MKNKYNISIAKIISNLYKLKFTTTNYYDKIYLYSIIFLYKILIQYDIIKKI